MGWLRLGTHIEGCGTRTRNVGSLATGSLSGVWYLPPSQCDYVIALDRLVLDALIVADGLSNVYDNEQ